MLVLTEQQKKRFLCKTNLLTGGDTDLSGFRAPTGGACANCEGCSTALGELGLIGERSRLVGGLDFLDIAWTCPGCGCEVTESTTPLQSLVDVAACESDPLCYRCRKAQPKASP